MAEVVDEQAEVEVFSAADTSSNQVAGAVGDAERRDRLPKRFPQAGAFGRVTAHDDPTAPLDPSDWDDAGQSQASRVI